SEACRPSRCAPHHTHTSDPRSRSCDTTPSRSPRRRSNRPTAPPHSTPPTPAPTPHATPTATQHPALDGGSLRGGALEGTLDVDRVRGTARLDELSVERAALLRAGHRDRGVVGTEAVLLVVVDDQTRGVRTRSRRAPGARLEVDRELAAAHG